MNVSEIAKSVGEQGVYDQDVTIDKVLFVYRNTPLILLGNLLGIVPLLIIFWNTEYSSVSFYWASALSLVLLIRLFQHKRVDLRAASYEEIKHFDKVQTTLVFLTGAVWGSAGVLMFDDSDIKNLSYLILTFISMIAGSLVSLSPRPNAYMAFSVSMMGPLIVTMLLYDDSTYRRMGVGATIYLLVILGFSKAVYKMVDNSLRLKYENLGLIKDLQEQTDRANKASQEKSQFLASASHDLRQPLQAVNLYAEVLSKKVTTIEQEIDVNNIRQGLNSLNELLDALFDVSRLDSDTINANIISFRINDIFHKLERQFVLEAKISNLEFKIDYEDIVVRSDPVLLERVVTNLLVNAFRYTKEGGINVFFKRLDDSYVEVHVCDTGIGISEENKDAIFQEFFQVQNQERDRSQGLGLGLAIVRRVVDLLGHKIEVHSQLGKGTDFVLTLPLSYLPAERNAMRKDDVEATDVLDGLDIMVIDNEAFIVDAMHSLLKEWGANCSSFLSTQDALDALNNGMKPRFLIVDYRMPGEYNGCTFVQKARQIVKDVPALIVTGDTSDEMVAEFQALGIDYLYKPIKPAQLRMMVSRVLRRETAMNDHL